MPAVQTLAGELETAHDETVRWLTSVLADLAGGQAALEASPLQRVAAHVTRAANAPSRPALDDVGATVTRTVESATAVGKEVGKDVKAHGTARLGVETADTVVDAAGTRRPAAQRRRRRGGRRGTPAATPRRRRPGNSPGPWDPVQTAAPDEAAPAPDAEPIVPPIPGFADLPAHAAVAALRTLDDPRAVAAMLEFEQAHGNRPGVVAAARLRATTVRTG